jgi:hypothetical protein
VSRLAGFLRLSAAVFAIRNRCCTDKICLRRTKAARATVRVDAGAKIAASKIPPEHREAVRLVTSTPRLQEPHPPYVFPMSPITVSSFLGRADVTQAPVFCLGVIVFFTSLGAAMKAIAGPFGVVVLGSSPWVNEFASLVFVAFSLSLLGRFEMTLPSRMLIGVDPVSRCGPGSLAVPPEASWSL